MRQAVAEGNAYHKVKSVVNWLCYGRIKDPGAPPRSRNGNRLRRTSESYRSQVSHVESGKSGCTGLVMMAIRSSSIWNAGSRRRRTKPCA